MRPVPVWQDAVVFSSPGGWALLVALLFTLPSVTNPREQFQDARPCSPGAFGFKGLVCSECVLPGTSGILV